jgi:hypothetical protein
MNNIPTINVPILKSTTPTTAKPRTTRNSSEGRMRSALLPKKLSFEQDVENKVPEEDMNELKRLRKENQKLKEKMEQLTQEHSEKVEDLTNTITEFLANTITELKLKQNEFSLETFKDNSKLFMFYTGFQSYDLLKGDLQSDLRMCTKEPTFYDTNSLTMFWVLAKPDCCFLIIYYTLEA